MTEQLEIATLFPDDTGLLIIIRVYSQGEGEPFIRISNDYNRYNYKDTFDVSLNKPYSIISGRSTVNQNEIELLYNWIEERHIALMRAWNNDGSMSSMDFVKLIK